MNIQLPRTELDSDEWGLFSDLKIGPFSNIAIRRVKPLGTDKLLGPKITRIRNIPTRRVKPLGTHNLSGPDGYYSWVSYPNICLFVY